MITVTFLGALEGIFKRRTETFIGENPVRLEDLIDLLRTRVDIDDDLFPLTAMIRGVVNGEIVNRSHIVEQGDEVQFFRVVAGG
ncbi:MoaD/ThiS family protein [Paraburkholderia caledonica]|uniref:Molybdopterin converting factor small subunit n=1 Tax=Paraburkholderia caledonica TaxID=134536 RepID=A0AB73IN56_9BURK|nr:molybdopterin converting factor small subunit [Paraburkholderia caledonica]